mgnify:CR=1 FL=1
MFNTPTKIGPVTLKNRLVMAPMTTYSSNPDYTVSDQEYTYYEARGQTVGMLITAAVAVSKSAHAFPRQISIEDDRFIPGLKTLAEKIQAGGAKAVMQLHHGGRMADASLFANAHDIVAPSAIKADRNFTVTPRAMSLDEVRQTQKDFLDAISRAIQAGYDGVELHGANTYLLQQFFSPQSNQRTDEYGGSIENRSRFIVELVKAAQERIQKEATKPFLLGYRLSPEERETPGITLADTRYLIKQLNALKVDYLHLSTGHYLQSSLRDPANTTPIIERLSDVLSDDVPLIGVGGINDLEDVENALESGYECVATGMTLIADPLWGEKLASKDPLNTVITSDLVPDLMFERLHRWQKILAEGGRFILKDD